MKKVTATNIFATLMIVIMIALSVVQVLAADQILERKISQIVFRNDKNGNPYARILVPEPKTLNGVTYTKDTSILVFGDLVKDAKVYKKGDTVKAVVSASEFRGGISYQALKFLK